MPGCQAGPNAELLEHVQEPQRHRADGRLGDLRVAEGPIKLAPVVVAKCRRGIESVDESRASQSVGVVPEGKPLVHGGEAAGQVTKQSTYCEPCPGKSIATTPGGGPVPQHDLPSRGRPGKPVAVCRFQSDGCLPDEFHRIGPTPPGDQDEPVAILRAERSAAPRSLPDSVQSISPSHRGKEALSRSGSSLDFQPRS